MGDFAFDTREDWLRWVRRKDRPTPDEVEERRENEEEDEDGSDVEE